MVKRNFDKWLTSFRASIATYDYYVNYDKVYHNVDDIKIELNILNSLIGSKCIEKDFLHIVNKYPEVLQCIPILLAVRDKEIFCRMRMAAFSIDLHLMKKAYYLQSSMLTLCRKQVCLNCFLKGLLVICLIM